MIKNSPWKVGALQALGLALYVSCFALTIQAFSGTSFKINPFASIAIFLMTFIISASICGSIALLYPILLFLDNKKKQAIQIIFWNIGWLLVIFLVFLVIILI